MNAQALGEVAHVVLALRHDARDQKRPHAPLAQPRLKPRDVLRGAAHIQARDDAKNLQRSRFSLIRAAALPNSHASRVGHSPALTGLRSMYETAAAKCRSLRT